MPSLKDLKNRIKSVKSTQKITKAMKMVAAAKLRRAKDAAEAARPYAEAMEAMLANLAASVAEGSEGPKLISGNGKSETHLIVVATSDRGLCGGFNSTIVRATRRKVRELQGQGLRVKLLFVGRKGYEQLTFDFASITLDKMELPKKRIAYSDAENISTRLVELFDAGEFDVCHIVYNKFKSAISQEVTFQQLIPLALSKAEASEKSASASYDYEPEEQDILTDLLPRNLGVQVYRAMLENAASEQGARMTAMDNATRNAGDMIKKLNLKYNRTRQAAITKELIEIISGAEAV
ncbi:MAG: F0F1 ATP synthase subunit gamma [Alphaproteobacteria bacterium]|nr:F0F1 ATP synthase subunit gamma [Alphaproteobacteria bacterium]